MILPLRTLRILSGCTAAALFAYLAWYGDTRFADFSQTGAVLQAPPGLYDTTTLTCYLSKITKHAAADDYRRFVLLGDTIFIATLVVFMTSMLWPWRRVAFTYALTYALLDFTENALLLSELNADTLPPCENLPSIGAMSVAGVVTALKYATLILISATIVWKWMRRRA